MALEGVNYYNLTGHALIHCLKVSETIKTWSIMETLISVMGLLSVLVASLFV